MISYHLTVRGALQEVARLARTSPYVAVIETPIAKAEAVTQKQVDRYPTITASHVTRTHLRKAKLSVVQMVVMPPKGGMVTVFLMANVPPNSRENWWHALDEEDPFNWRNYQLTRGKNNAVTWRLSEGVRAHYRKRIARLIAGRSGKPVQGEAPYMLPTVTAAKEIHLLAEHLQRYPGLSGIRADVFELAQYSTKVWTNTRPKFPFPVWPTMQYMRFEAAKMAPISTITQHLEESEPDDVQDPEEDQATTS